MTDFKKMFRIEKDERAWVLLLAATMLCIVAANVILFDTLLAFLVKRAGVRFVPYFYITSSIMMTVGAWITLGPMRRFRTIFQSVLFACAATVGAALLSFFERYVPAGAGLLPIFLFIACGLFVNSVSITGLIDKTFVTESDVFNIEQLQRLDPVITSASTLSGFLGGVFLAAFGAKVDPSVLYAVVAGLLACSVCAVGLIYQRAKKDRMLAVTAPVAIIEDKSAKKKAFDLFGSEGTVPVRKFIVLMSLFIVVGMVLYRLFGYQFNIAADSKYATEGELNAFFGAYTAVASVAGLVFINTVRRYLFAKYGIMRNMIAPLVISLAGIGVIAAFPVFGVVIVATFVRDLAAYLQFANDFFLQGMSDYLRNRAATWLSGPVSTAGGLIGSGLLIAVTALLPKGVAPALMLRTLAIVAACFLLLQIVIALRLRKVFFPLLRSAATGGDFKTRLRAIEAMAEAKFSTQRDCGPLIGIVADESSPNALRIAGLKTIATMGDLSCLRLADQFIGHPNLALRREAIKAVASFPLEAIDQKSEGYLETSLAEALRKAFVKETVPDAMDDILNALVRLDGPSVIPFLTEQLRSPSPERLASVLRAMRKMTDISVADIVRPFLTHADPRVRAQAAANLWILPKQRDASVQAAVKALLDAPHGSAEHREGVYLVGALPLRDEVKRLENELKEEVDDRTRFVAAVSLLKLGRESGIRELERVLGTGTKEQAFEVERLTEHGKVPEEQRARITTLVHKWHMHYPRELPVSEPLRVRLHDIPRTCLEALLPYYASEASASNKRKILEALRLSQLPEPVGQVALVHLDGTWKDMAAVELLSHGYAVRIVNGVFTRQAGEVAVGYEGDPALGSTDVVLSHNAAAEGRAVAMSHFAPSELLTAVRNAAGSNRGA